MQSKPKCWVAVLAVPTLLGVAVGAEGPWEANAPDEPPRQEDRLAQIEAELAELGARLDEIPPKRSKVSSTGTHCSQARGLYAGYAFVFAKPHFSDGVNYIREVTRDIPPGSGNIHSTTSVPFSYDYELTPRAWVGYTRPDGLGIRARYWQFDHAGDIADLVVPVGTGNEGVMAVIGSRWGTESIQPYAEGLPLHITNSVELHAADFELTQQIDFHHTCGTASMGLRYASIHQSYLAEHTFDYAGALMHRSLFNRHDFESLGPTAALEMRRSLGGSGWAVFADARGSVLFGERDIRYARYDEVSPSLDSFRRDDFHVVGVGELQFGIEWSRWLRYGGAMFVRAAYEGQLWHAAGSPSHSTGDLGFEAASLAIGFSR